jgi:tight adherence protein C
MAVFELNRPSTVGLSGATRTSGYARRAIEFLAKPSTLSAGGTGAILGAVLRGPVGALTGGVGLLLALEVWRHLRFPRRRNQATPNIPEAVEMVAVASMAGLNPYMSLLYASEAPPPGCEQVFEALRAMLLAGKSPVEALNESGRKYRVPELFAVARAVGGCERHGHPLAPVLQKLAEDLRERRLRSAQADARRAPVRVLFPLVFCVLPAFVLLTVVPVLVDTFRVVRS